MDRASPAAAIHRDDSAASDEPADDAAIDLILQRGPGGALAVAGVATVIVVAIYFAFYLFVYLPRGAVQ